ncbi:MAG: hypothetical protein R3B46_04895 [Phycisphaerales bacterium]
MQHVARVLFCALCAIGMMMSKGPPALVCLGAAMVVGRWCGVRVRRRNGRGRWAAEHERGRR